jgi:hypothetical protein
VTVAQISNSRSLGEVIRALGLGWRLDLYRNAEDWIPHLERRLQEADRAAAARFIDGSVRITLDSLADFAGHFPDRATTFASQLFFQGSPEMLVMGWRVLHEVEVGAVHLDLEQASRFRLEVSLWPDRTGAVEKYISDEVYDMHLIGQFGVSKLNGKFPLLVGFYPAIRKPS